jgi:hypothetical protein
MKRRQIHLLLWLLVGVLWLLVILIIINFLSTSPGHLADASGGGKIQVQRQLIDNIKKRENDSAQRVIDSLQKRAADILDKQPEKIRDSILNNNEIFQLMKQCLYHQIHGIKYFEVPSLEKNGSGSHYCTFFRWFDTVGSFDILLDNKRLYTYYSTRKGWSMVCAGPGKWLDNGNLSLIKIGYDGCLYSPDHEFDPQTGYNMPPLWSKWLLAGELIPKTNN